MTLDRESGGKQRLARVASGEWPRKESLPGGQRGSAPGEEPVERCRELLRRPLDPRLYRAMAKVFRVVPERSIDAAYFFARRHTEPLVHEVLLFVRNREGAALRRAP